jgi:hypothetical protein
VAWLAKSASKAIRPIVLLWLSRRIGKRWAALLVCHTLVLLPAVYPTHQAYRLRADYGAAAKYRQATAEGSLRRICAATALAPKSCCSRAKAPADKQRPKPCPVCREFSNFILLEAEAITVPAGIELIVAMLSDAPHLSLPQCSAIDRTARAPPSARFT